MNDSWLKTVFPIAAIFSFRMLGLFMLVPVFTVLTVQLHDATPTLIGFALGSYGLTQGLFQIPFGMLSDYFGRKPLLVLGLILFAGGSLISALSHSIYTLITGRILQGAGAIGSVLIALVADLTAEQHRTKAMAVIGMVIGMSFGLAIIISPLITSWFGLSGIFYLSTFLALAGLLLVYFVIPTPLIARTYTDDNINFARLKSVLHNKYLQQINAGIFFQHFIFTATFYALPILLHQLIRQGNLSSTWYFYCSLIFFSFLAMPILVFIASKAAYEKNIIFGAIFFTGLIEFFLVFFNQYSLFLLWTILFIYIVSFNILEACLPSFLSKVVDPKIKGTAMGIYSSSQFLGIFLGGSCAGLLYQFGGSPIIFITNTFLGAIWLLVALRIGFKLP